LNLLAGESFVTAKVTGFAYFQSEGRLNMLVEFGLYRIIEAFKYQAVFERNVSDRPKPRTKA
jgi:hypothetical protein